MKKPGLILLAVAATLTASPSQADWANMYRFSDRPEPAPATLPPAAQPGLQPGPSQPLSGGVPDLPALSGNLVMPGETVSDQPQTQPQPQGMTAAAAPMQGQGAAADTALCLREILGAETRYGIPGHLLLAIGLQEAGTSEGGQLTVWPWSVNAEGQGRMFADPVEAMNWVEEKRRAGTTSIDVGCMQMNLHWHGEKFANLSEAFDPYTNVDASARYLTTLYAETGDWGKAAGAYHSRDTERQKIYLTSLERNLAVATQEIATFQALAGMTTEAPLLRPYDAQGEVTLAASAETTPLAPVDPDQPLWSAGLGTEGGETTARYGLYSRKSLQPVLPAFTKTF